MDELVVGMGQALGITAILWGIIEAASRLWAIRSWAKGAGDGKAEGADEAS